MRHELTTGRLLALGLATGLAAGLLLGRQWALTAERSILREARQLQARAARWHDPISWVRDSTAREEYYRNQPPTPQPVEISRQQRFTDCIAIFVIPDPLPFKPVLLEARGQSLEGGIQVGRGIALQPGGFVPGEEVAVALPDVQCQRLGTLFPILFPATSPPPFEWAPLVPDRPRHPAPM